METPEGIRNFEDIVSVAGLDIIAMGPFDLSQALGYGGDWKHPDVRHKQEEMIRVARSHELEVMAAIFDSNPEGLRRQVEGWKRHQVVCLRSAVTVSCCHLATSDRLEPGAAASRLTR